MTYRLCRWLNEDLRLSTIIEPQTFDRSFSNGFLIGEILHRYDLLTDFTVFVDDNSKSSKVNNFIHLKPTLEALGIYFDGIMIQEVMLEKQDVASHLIHELYVALEQKKKGTIVRAPSTHLHKTEQELHSEMLYRGFGLSENMNISEMIRQTQNVRQQLEYKPMNSPSAQEKKPPVKDNIKRQVNKKTTLQQTKALQKQKEQQKCREKQAQTLQDEIHQFEAKTKNRTTSAKSEYRESDAESMQNFNSEYIQQIRLRVKMDADTEKQKESRSAHFLVEQSKALKAEQEAQFEDSLVKRLTRQTMEDERLVAQLLQIRSEKEELLKNNLIRQQQVQKRREADYREALEREAAEVRQKRLDNAAEIEQELVLREKLTAERKQNRHMKHFNSCKEIMGQIVDLATKAGDYLILTGGLIPRKQMKEWKELLFSGLPLYETQEENKVLDPEELLKQEAQNKHDYEEYKNMVGEWVRPETQKTETEPGNSRILNHIFVRLRNIVHPPPVEPFPPFSLKACVLGRPGAGKSTCLDKIAQACGFYILSIDRLVEEVLSEYHSTEQESGEQDVDKSLGQDQTEESTNTKWSVLGEAADKVIKEGKAIPDELLVDIITETIKQLPAHSGWILDGFPLDITQAHLLEKALGGAVEKVDEAIESHTNFTASAPALDLALFLDVPDECVASRAADQTDENKSTHMSHRAAAFEDTWPELEEWFGQKQNILIRVNANVDETELFKEVESILQQPPAGKLPLKLDNCLPFVDEPLPLDTAESLCLQWDTATESYMNKVKAVLQNLRLQCTATEQRLNNYIEEFKLYLSRADPKQDLLSRWQKEFNRIYLHTQKDKLQERLDDLLEELWDISDKRREENEQKIIALKEDGWLLSCTSVLQKHLATLFQVEVEQFQHLLCVLKVYYLSMFRQTTVNNDLQPQEETEPFKLPNGHLIYNYEDALTAVCSLISAQAQLFKIETLQEDEETLPRTDENCNNGYTVLNKISYEYTAVLNQMEDAVKSRLHSVQSHYSEMVKDVQSKADQVIDSLETLVKEQFVEEMKSIDQVADVVGCHIESEPKLQNGPDLISILSHQNVDYCPGTAPPPTTD